MSSLPVSQQEKADEVTNEQQTLHRLRSMLSQVDETLRFLQASKAAQRGSSAKSAGQIEEMKKRLLEIEEDRQSIMDRLIEAEQHASRLMTLYVATYDLHASLEPAEVEAAIADIAVNLLGAEHFALLLVTDSGDFDCEVAQLVGDDQAGLFQGARYRGGDPVIDEALTEGAMSVGPFPNSKALAVVPLTVQGIIVGALVILRLLSHKPELGPHDKEMLDLLGAHAASALFAARVYKATDSKLKTLEGLVGLLKPT